jgi:hypothetical protein
MGSMLELLKKGRMCSFGSPRPGDVTVAIWRPEKFHQPRLIQRLLICSDWWETNRR